MTEQQRIEEYKQNCRQNAYDIFHRNTHLGDQKAHNYLSHKFALLKAYQTGVITLRELNNEL